MGVETVRTPREAEPPRHVPDGFIGAPVSVAAGVVAAGGLTALGVNVTVMGVVTVLVAYGLFRWPPSSR